MEACNASADWRREEEATGVAGGDQPQIRMTGMQPDAADLAMIIQREHAKLLQQQQPHAVERQDAQLRQEQRELKQLQLREAPAETTALPKSPGVEPARTGAWRSQATRPHVAPPMAVADDDLPSCPSLLLRQHHDSSSDGNSDSEIDSDSESESESSDADEDNDDSSTTVHPKA